MRASNSALSGNTTSDTSLCALSPWEHLLEHGKLALSQAVHAGLKLCSACDVGLEQQQGRVTADWVCDGHSLHLVPVSNVEVWSVTKE